VLRGHVGPHPEVSVLESVRRFREEIKKSRNQEIKKSRSDPKDSFRLFINDERTSDRRHRFQD